MHTEHSHTTGKLTIPENDLHENLEYFFRYLVMMAIKFFSFFLSPVHTEMHTTHHNAESFTEWPLSPLSFVKNRQHEMLKKIGCSKYKSKDVQENIS